jgi:amphi-Trp domain-containing protein
VVSIPSRFRGRARRDAAAFYLSELARGLLAGEVGILVGHEAVPVRPADFLALDIAVSRKGRATHVSVRIRWLHPRASTPGAGAAAGDSSGHARRVT